MKTEVRANLRLVLAMSIKKRKRKNRSLEWVIQSILTSRSNQTANHLIADWNTNIAALRIRLFIFDIRNHLFSPVRVESPLHIIKESNGLIMRVNHLWDSCFISIINCIDSPEFPRDLLLHGRREAIERYSHFSSSIEFPLGNKERREWKQRREEWIEGQSGEAPDN